MSKLVAPHGGKGLVICKLEGAELEAELKKAEGLKKIEISSQVKGDLIMLGIGGFSPLNGFMTKADWKGVCADFLLADGTFWPVPVMLDAAAADAAEINEGDEIALERDGEVYATMKVEEKFEMTEDEKNGNAKKYTKATAKSLKTMYSGRSPWKIIPAFRLLWPEKNSALQVP